MTKMKAFIFGLILLVSADARSFFVPNSACGSQVPQHSFPLKPGGGYIISFPRANVWTAGVPVDVTITSTSAGFKGVMLSAGAQSNNARVGSWVADGSSMPFSCDRGTVALCHQACEGESTLTHNEPSLKFTFTGRWIPPAAGTGPVNFQATLVRDISSWYTVSAPLNEFLLPPCPSTPALGDCNGPLAGTCVTINPQPNTQERVCRCNPGYLGSNCGVVADNGQPIAPVQAGFPNDPNKLIYQFRYKIVENEIFVQLRANKLGWIGFILDHDSSGGMNQADVWVVQVDSNTGKASALDRWAPRNLDLTKSNAEIVGALAVDAQQDLKDISGWKDETSGFMSVNFKRALVTNDPQNFDKDVRPGVLLCSYAADTNEAFQFHGPGTESRGKVEIKFLDPPSAVPPGLPINLRATLASTDMIRLEWQAPPNLGSELMYRFDVYLLGNAAVEVLFDSANALYSVNITGLPTPNTNYNFGVQGVSRRPNPPFFFEYLGLFANVTARTLAGVADPFDPPTALVTTQILQDRITVSWNASDITTTNGDPLPCPGVPPVFGQPIACFGRYEVIILGNFSRPPDPRGKFVQEVSFFTDQTSFQFVSLDPSNPYTIKVRALSTAGPSGFSNVINVNTIAPPLACAPSGCGPLGTCNPDETCNCPPGRMGPRCEFGAQFGPLSLDTTGADRVKAWWSNEDDGMRIQFAWKSDGWFSVILDHDASGGMDNGDCWIFYIDPLNNKVTAEDRYSFGFDVPPLDSALGGRNDLTEVAGGLRADGYRYVQVKRPYVTVDAFDKPFIQGAFMRTSWAFFSNNFLQYHQGFVGKRLVPWFQTLQFSGPPQPPQVTQPYQTKTNDTSIRIRWDPPRLINPKDPIRGYQVERRDAFGVFLLALGCQTPNASIGELAQTSCDVTGLQAGAVYQFRIRTVTDRNSSVPSNVFAAQTLSEFDKLPEAPSALTVLGAGVREIFVGWQHSAVNQYGLPLVTFWARVRNVATGIVTEVDIGFRDGLNSPYQANITGLASNTQYTIDIKTETIKGNSTAYSNQVTAATTTQTRGCGQGDRCSSRGVCDRSVPAAPFCKCQAGFLGFDCAVSNPGGKPAYSIIFNGVGFTMYWAIDERNQEIYARLETPSQGWAGIMLRPGGDGMSNADTWVVGTNFDGSFYAADMKCPPGKVTPNNDDTVGGTQDLQEIIGYTEKGRNFVSFKRKLDTHDSQDYAIGAGSIVVTWAYSDDAGFAIHPSSNQFRGKAEIDFITGEAKVTEPRSRLDFIAFGLPLAVCGVVSILLLQVRSCRQSKCGQCCLRNKVGKLRAKNWCDTLTYDIFPALLDMTWGEFFIASMYIVGFLLYLIAASITYTKAKREYAYVAGQLSAIHMALTILPVARTSFWSGVFGISFERGIKWHRWIGRITIAVVSAHGITMLQMHELADVLNLVPREEGLGNLWGFLCWICVGIMYFTSFETIRRKVFELFYYTHYLFVPGFLFACLHSKTAFWLSIGPIILYLFDRAVRFVKSRRIVKVLDARVLEKGSERVTMLRLSVPGFSFQGGDYCFLQVSGLGAFEWHPFSISSFPGEAGDPFTFHILDMGPGTWTNKLSTQVDNLLTGKTEISVDGPYGSISLNIFDYPNVVLCCGGVGATPMFAVLGDLLNRYKQGRLRHIKRVDLFWVNNGKDPIRDWFTELLTQIKSQGAPFYLHLYATGNPKKGGSKSVGSKSEKDVKISIAMTEIKKDGEASPSSDSKGAPANNSVEDTDITKGRPEYNQEFDNLAIKTGSDCAVLACGPQPMVAAVQSAATTRGFHFHKETFFF